MSVDQEPGWYPDPTGRCVLRRWDGATWTAEVVRAGDMPGTTSNDPIALSGLDEERVRPAHETQGSPVQPAPAGWHPDPAGEDEFRYWDGATWTAWVADQARQVRQSDRDVGEWPAPREGVASTTSLPGPDYRLLPIFGVIILGFAALSTFLFWWNPNLLLFLVGYWFDDQSVLAVWAWVAVIDSILIVVALVLSGASTRRRLGIGIALVAVACIPLAFAVHARLPHNPIPDYQAALDRLERVVPQLQRRGPERVRTRCEWGGWSEDRHAYVSRRYALTDGDREDTMETIVAFFEAMGYEPGVQPTRRWYSHLYGPNTSIDIVSDRHLTEPHTTFKIRLERQSCSPLE